MSSARPVTRVRISHTEVSTVDLHTPGNLSRVLKKLKNLSQSRQIGRGTACQRCKSKKSKCDGSRPCKTCMKANLPCDAICNDDDLLVMERGQKVDWPVPAPEGYNLRMCKDAVPPPLEVGNLFRLGFEYGLPVPKMASMLSAMPPKLLGALGQLLDRLLSAGPPPLDVMPQNDDRHMGYTSNVIGVSFWRSADGSCENVTYAGWEKLAGAHPEEVSARVASQDMPQPMSEYRILCNHLNLLLHTILCPNAVFQNVFPILQNHVNQDQTGEDKWLLVRSTCRPYADGFIATLVELRPEEYDRAVAQVPEARGAFTECDLSGHELANVKDLLHRETISVMMQTPEGRGKLERLADKIVAAFHLNELPPPPGGMPPSLAMGPGMSSFGASSPRFPCLPHGIALTTPSDIPSIPHALVPNSPDPSLLASFDPALLAFQPPSVLHPTPLHPMPSFDPSAIAAMSPSLLPYLPPDPLLSGPLPPFSLL